MFIIIDVTTELDIKMASGALSLEQLTQAYKSLLSTTVQQTRELEQLRADLKKQDAEVARLCAKVQALETSRDNPNAGASVSARPSTKPATREFVKAAIIENGKLTSFFRAFCIDSINTQKVVDWIGTNACELCALVANISFEKQHITVDRLLFEPAAGRVNDIKQCPNLVKIAKAVALCFEDCKDYAREHKTKRLVDNVVEPFANAIVLLAYLPCDTSSSIINRITRRTPSIENLVCTGVL